MSDIHVREITDFTKDGERSITRKYVLLDDYTSREAVLMRELAESEAVKESLQTKWANRPLDHPSGDALMVENDRLTRERDEAIKYRDDEFQLRDALSNENTRLRAALQSIARNTCCDKCQEAALVAREALGEKPSGPTLHL